MDAVTPSAPAVVATVVVHDPGPWFDEVLDGLADQDYPNLKLLFLVATADEEEAAAVRARVGAVLPRAHVRALGANPGFGPAANEVMRLVEGESGLFCLLHDDVALEPDAVSVLVEELYRSNAGIVAPKLVDWDDPGVLQHVGFDMDRFGELDGLVERGEVDQEQHDAVRDVFVVSSACLLVRADLFRALGGFDPEMSFHGEDRELCWRAHLSGARVLVVPSARARHRGRMQERQPDLAHRSLSARHRLRAVATLTGRWRFLALLPVLLLLNLTELVVGVFTGRAGSAAAALRAYMGLVPQAGSIASRRREIAHLRQVPDREVAGLQLRGSARLGAYLRSRGATVAVRSPESRRARVREVSPVTGVVWIAVLALCLVGGRGLISGGVRTVGEMLAFPDSASGLLDEYRSGWWQTGLGRTGASPTGFGVLGAGGLVLLGNMGLLRMLGVVGVILLGYLGMWRLCTVFPQAMARAAGLAVYAAVPLPYAATAAGRWQAVLAYAAVPWSLHLVRRVGGLADAGIHEPDDVVDVVAPVSFGRRVRQVAALALVLAVAGAFSPSVVLVVLVAALAWLVAAALVRASLGAALLGVAAALAAAVVALLLHLPWTPRYFDSGGWDAVVGPELAGPADLGLARLARFGVGPSTLGPLAIALYLPVVAAVLVARGWRLAWAARGAVLVLAFGALALLDDQGSLPLRLPEPGILLAPVAVGLALCAAVAIGSFRADVRGARFGWRQPVGILAAAAVAVGIVPGIAAAADGHWHQPAISVADQLSELLPDAVPEGDYRVLFVGDPRLMPVASWSYADGVAYALHDDGAYEVTETWVGPDDVERRSVGAALDTIAVRSTARAGRLLAPLGVRYVVVPLFDRVNSTPGSPLPPPAGLFAALGDQLDLRRAYSSSDFVVYENTAWLPVRSALSVAAGEASSEAGAEALVSVDLGTSSPLFVGSDALSASEDRVPAGTVHVALAHDERWQLDLGGEQIEPRRAFGATIAFDAPAAGDATLSYEQPTSRTLALVLQGLLWLATVLVALGLPWSRLWRRRQPVPVVSPFGPPVIRLDTEETDAQEVQQ